jgi:hypothetical protein
MADELFKKLNFSISEREKVKKIVKGIYAGLLFRKATTLIPLDSEKRQAKRMDFLKQDIDNHRLFMIYCYNNFTELQLSKNSKDSKDELRVFTVPIEGILENDDFYKKLLKKQKNMDELMSIGDRIEKLQQKTKKSYNPTELMYADMMAKIEKTCKKVLTLIGIKDPVKLSIIMLFIFDTVHITETELINSVIDKVKDEGEGKDKGDPCDANKYLGIDFSFLGFFDKLPEECQSKNESTKISIVGPVELHGLDGLKVQSTDGSKVQSTDGSKVQSTDGLKVQSTDGSKVQTKVGGSKTRKHKNAKKVKDQAKQNISNPNI